MTRGRPEGWLRRQLPAYSPLTGGAIAAAISAVVRAGDARGSLAGLLHEEYEATTVTLCGSGTDALQRAIRSAARQRGARVTVALPAYSCFDVATAAVGADAGIALYDVDPHTLSPDLDSLERTLRNGAAVAVIAPLYGLPVTWDTIERVAFAAGAEMIEDAAQGHGAQWRGRTVGTLARISTLSFGRGKGWTGGSGGALLLRACAGSAPSDPAGASAEAQTIAAATAQWLFGRPHTYGLLAALPWLHLGETIYHDPAPPRDLAHAAAAIAFAVRRLAMAAVSHRRSAAEFYRERLTGSPRLQLAEVVPGANPGWVRFPVRVRGGMKGIGNSGDLRRLGVMGGYPTPLSALPAVRARLVGPEMRWPGAEELARELITLPTHEMVGAAERDRIANSCMPASTANRLLVRAQRDASSTSRNGKHEVTHA